MASSRGGVRALVLGDDWFRTDSTLSALVHQFVHFLRRYEVSVYLLYPRDRTNLGKEDEAEMRECGLDGVLCAQSPTGQQTKPPEDCLRQNHSAYYEYMLRDPQSFANLTHVFAFAPEMASTAIRIKEDLAVSYRREVKVVLINYRTMSYDTDELLLGCLEEQDWFSSTNISQVWSIGQSLFDHYETTHMHGHDPAPHNLYLFRPTFDHINPDPEQLRLSHALTVLPSDSTESTIKRNTQLKVIGTAVKDIQGQVSELGQNSLQWTIVTRTKGLAEELRQPGLPGPSVIKDRDSRFIAKRRAFVNQLKQLRVYVSPTEDDNAFNALDWLLVGSGLPTLVSAHSCVGVTLERLGRHHNSNLPNQFVVRPPAFGNIQQAWTRTLSEVLCGGGGQTAIKNAQELRDLIQRSDFIGQIEENFVDSLQHAGVEPVGASTDPFLVGRPSLRIFPRVTEPSKDLTVPELRKVAELLVGDWYPLGVKLKVESHRLDALVAPAQGGPERHPFRMLKMWHRHNADKSPAALVRWLIVTLNEAHLASIGENVQLFYDNNVKSERDLEQLFEHISGSLIPNWKDLGYRLGLTFEDVSAISAPEQPPDNPALAMLQMWRTSTLMSERRPRLIQALRDLQRLDIVKHLETEATTGGNAVQPVSRGAQSAFYTRDTTPPPQGAPFGDSGQPLPGNPRIVTDSASGNHRVEETGVFFGESTESLDRNSSVKADSGTRYADRFVRNEDGEMRSMVLPGYTKYVDMLNAGHSQVEPAQSDDARPPPSSTLTAVVKVSVEAETEDSEEEDVYELHRPTGARPEPIEELNPDYLWMGSEYMRLLKATEGGAYKRVVVALLDSGVNISHPDLQGLVINSHNCVYGEPAQDLDLITDDHNHGTMSAGILWQYAGSRIVQIINLKVLRHDGRGNLSYVANALEYIKKWDKDHPSQRVDIVLMTLGNPRPHKKADRLLSELGEDKILICSAANDGQQRPDSVLSPASHASVIAIGSCTISGSRCDHSAVGQQLDFLFPGEKIMSTSSSHQSQDPMKRNKYEIVTGTSFAAPHCAALVAILLTYIQVQFNNFGGKTGMLWRERMTSSSRMKSLLQKHCGRTFTYDMGFGSPQLGDITRNSLIDFFKKNWSVSGEQ